MKIRSLKSTAFLTFSALAISGLTSACVTVNVNFPESTVQKATDDYVKELYKAKEKGRSSPTTDANVSPKKSAPPKPDVESGPGAGDSDPAKPEAGGPQSFNKGFFDLESEAFAAEADFVFNVNTPKASKIQEKLIAKLAEVDTQKQAGNLGEGSDGLLVIKATQPLLVKKLEPLVKDQNSHREDLYEEIQTANKMAKSRLADIRKSFARSFQKHSPAGTWVQDPTGGWSQK